MSLGCWICEPWQTGAGGLAEVRLIFRLLCVCSEVSMTTSGSVPCFSWTASNMSSCGATSSPILPLSMRVPNAGDGKRRCSCSQTWRPSEFLRTFSPMVRCLVYGYPRHVSASCQSPKLHTFIPHEAPKHLRISRFWLPSRMLPSGARPWHCWAAWGPRALCR